MRIKQVPIDQVTPYDLNPRHNESAVRKVADSIEEFGWQQPIVVDTDKVVIAGHTRLAAAHLLGLAKVPISIADNLTPEQVRSYRLADNKVAEYSEWDEQLLIDELSALQDSGADLSKTGFEDAEIEALLGAEVEEEERGQIIFSEELMESHNYVVLYFDNDVDWLSAQTHFGLKSVHSKRQNGKPWSKGIGRVVSGSAYLSSLAEEQ